MLYHVEDSRHAQNTQINKAIGENLKKNVYYILWKKTYRLYGQPDSIALIYKLLFSELRSFQMEDARSLNKDSAPKYTFTTVDSMLYSILYFHSDVNHRWFFFFFFFF